MGTIKVSNNKNTYEVDEADLPSALKDGYTPLISVEKGDSKHDVHQDDLPKALADGYAPIQHESLLKKVARGAIDTIPTLGMIGGGILGTPAGPAGNVGGAALGYAGGKELSGLLKHHLLGDESESVKPIDQVNRVTGNLSDGATYELGGQVLGAIPGAIKSGYGAVTGKVANMLGKSAEYTPIANKEAVEQAGDALGLKLPKGVLTDNPTYQKLESGLSQSGSFPAKGVRDQYNEMFKGLDTAAGKISDLKTPDSQFALGSNIQKDLSDQVNASRKPVTELYNDVAPSLQKIPVNKGITNTAFGALKKNPIFQTQDGKAMLEEYKNMVLDTPELASLKELRSSLSDSIGSTDAPIVESRISALRQAITSIRDNSINAMKMDLPKDMHGEVDDVIDKLALADKAHATNLSDVNSIKGIVGNKDFKSPVNFLGKLGDANEADLANRASNLDVTSLRNMQEKFPSVFDKAKQAKINDMIQGSTNAVSGFNEASFIKKYDGMDSELKDLIFSPEMKSHIENLKTVKQAIPPKLGPSGTPEGQMMMDMFNPKRNVMDLGIKKSLDMASKPEAIPNLTPQADSNVIQMPKAGALQSVSRNFQVVQPTQRAASSENKSDDKQAIIQKTQGTKYNQVLQNAANKGDDAFNAANYVLQGHYPEYRKILDKKDEQQQLGSDQ